MSEPRRASTGTMPVASGASRAHRRASIPRTAGSSISTDITVSFDGFKALNNLSLPVDAGELRCVIGPNGAGKTTMMDVITGKTRPDAGTAFFGQTIDLTRLTEAGNRPTRHRPQVPEADGVRAAHRCSRTSSSRMKTDKRVWPTLRARLDSARTRPDRRDAGDDQAAARGREARRDCSRTARSSGWRSACC